MKSKATAVTPKKVVPKATPKVSGPPDQAKELIRISKGLEQLSKLKAVFVKNQGEKLDGQEIAEGAMTTELGKKDSAVWSTIMDMVAAAQGAASKMNSAKTKDEK